MEQCLWNSVVEQWNSVGATVLWNSVGGTWEQCGRVMVEQCRWNSESEIGGTVKHCLWNSVVEQWNSVVEQ